MSKNQYMEILLEQIRSKKAREIVSKEIGAHIDDQAEVYQSKGMNKTEAERRAVWEMGDPVETGVSLDRIHKPQMSWGMIILVGVISVIRLIMLAKLGNMYGRNLVTETICYMIIGFALMMLICFLDYSRIAAWGGIISLCFIGICVLACLQRGTMSGYYCYLRLPGGIVISMKILIYLSIPLFGILLYRYRRKKWYHLLIPVAFMAVVILPIGSRIFSGSVRINLILMSAVLVTFAVAKGWYPVKKRLFLGILWGCLIGIPCAWVFGGLRLGIFPEYVKARLQFFFTQPDVRDYSYQEWVARDVLGNTRWIGEAFGSEIPWDVGTVASDYILLHIVSYYGILILLAIIALFAILCIKMFRMTFYQKNQLGMAMGLGCSLVLAVQIAEYFLMNFGLIPATTAFMPLFSYGGTGTIVSYLLLGILLSVYRYQNVVSDNMIRRPRIRLRIEKVED